MASSAASAASTWSARFRLLIALVGFLCSAPCGAEDATSQRAIVGDSTELVQIPSGKASLAQRNDHNDEWAEAEALLKVGYVDDPLQGQHSFHRSVCRFHTAVSEPMTAQPYLVPETVNYVGTGFVVQTEPYPLIVTNYHVIDGARSITCQFPLFSVEQFGCHVVVANEKYDLALVAFRDRTTLGELELQKLELSRDPLQMFKDVITLGFPLAQNTLKASKGIISGTEPIDQNICIQTTASISGGNSGGPLLDAQDITRVVGVNFATRPDGQNVNFAIPAWRVLQVLDRHARVEAAKPDDVEIDIGTEPTTYWEPQLVGAAWITPNPSLYQLSNGCVRGVYVTGVSVGTILGSNTTTPPLPPLPFFLEMVEGRPLDEFGYGVNRDFMEDRLPLHHLFSMNTSSNYDVTFWTCKNGNNTRHTVNTEWQESFTSRLSDWERTVSQLGAENWEVFGNVTVMNTVDNTMGGLALLGQAKEHAVIDDHDHENLTKSRHHQRRGEERHEYYYYYGGVVTSQSGLIVSFLAKHSYAEKVLTAFSSIYQVNGQNVSSVADFRAAFIPVVNKTLNESLLTAIWTMQTSDSILALPFAESVLEQQKTSLQPSMGYLMTDMIEEAVAQIEAAEAEEAAAPAPAAPAELQSTSDDATGTSAAAEEGEATGAVKSKKKGRKSTKKVVDGTEHSKDDCDSLGSMACALRSDCVSEGAQCKEASTQEEEFLNGASGKEDEEVVKRKKEVADLDQAVEKGDHLLKQAVAKGDEAKAASINKLLGKMKAKQQKAAEKLVAAQAGVGATLRESEKAAQEKAAHADEKAILSSDKSKDGVSLKGKKGKHSHSAKPKPISLLGEQSMEAAWESSALAPSVDSGQLFAAGPRFVIGDDAGLHTVTRSSMADSSS